MLKWVSAMMNRKRWQRIALEYTLLDVNTSKVLFTTPQVCLLGLHGLMQEKDYIVADLNICRHFQIQPCRTES